MKVIKRNGTEEALSIDKIKKRLQRLCDEFELKDIDVDIIVQETVKGLTPNMTTREIDEITSLIASHRSDLNPQYGDLAARIVVNDLHKSTPNTFCKAMESVRSILDDNFYKLVCKHKKALNSIIQDDRDYLVDFFGIKTFIKSYLLKDTGGITRERPQYLFLRVSFFLHREDWDAVKKSYDMMSRLYISHATPTLFNAGTKKPSLASCYLLGSDDSIDGMYRTVSQCASLSKACGGIGLHISNIRGSGSLIKSSNGISTGIVPFLKVLNATAKHVNQGGKRPGSIAIYLEPWHVDIMAFLDLRKNTGVDDQRARDLFTALWIPDIFMEAVKTNGDWYLFSADDVPLLSESHGAAFNELYKEYVSQGLYRVKIKAADIWRKALVSLFETGTPYISFKDRMNQGCTQKNLGILKSSNLCHEITLVSDADNIQVCVLGSIALSKMVDTLDYGPAVNMKRVYDAAYQLCMNLNRVIDWNYYPLEEASKTAFRDRPIGIGIQGFADMLYQMKYSFESPFVNQLVRDLHETIYHAAITASVDLAKKEGPYGSFQGSPWQEGHFQFDLLNTKLALPIYDWETLRTDIQTHGLRNSTLTAMMPTASSSILLGNYESFEPPTSMIMKRQTNAGDFIHFNKYLTQELVKRGLFSTQIRQAIIRDNGSIQHIKEIPQELKTIYQTAFEIDQSCLVQQSAIRQQYTDQAQSFNLFLASVDFNRLHRLLFQGWREGLKSGIYYLRSRALHQSEQFTILPQKSGGDTPKQPDQCVFDPTKPREGCESCSG